MGKIQAVKDKCHWILPNGQRCKLNATRGEYCYTHKPLADIGFSHDEWDNNVIADDKTIERWREEMEFEYERYKDEFPCYIDGLFFQSQTEYDDYYGTSPVRTKKQHLPASYPMYSWFPVKTLEKGRYEIEESIEHMRYIVVRDKEGLYRAVWMSMDSDEFEKDFANSIIQGTFPTTVTNTQYGRYYCSGSYATYSGASGRFFRGGESFFRIKERIRHARDEEHLPPNLRSLAFSDKIHLIPQAWREKLIAWKKKGHPGWWKGKYEYSTDSSRHAK